MHLQYMYTAQAREIELGRENKQMEGGKEGERPRLPLLHEKSRPGLPL